MDEKITVELTREQAYAVMNATELLARLVGKRIVEPERVADAGAHRLAPRLVISVGALPLALDDSFPIFVVAADFVLVIDFLGLHETRGQAERTVGDGDVFARKERRLAAAPRGVEVPPFGIVERVAVELVAQFRDEFITVAERTFRREVVRVKRSATEDKKNRRNRRRCSHRSSLFPSKVS